MYWKGRYDPVADEQVISCEHTVDECRDLLWRWCDQSRNGAERAHRGLVFKPFNKTEFCAYAQHDTRENTRYYYYRNHLLRIWLTESADGGSDIHYQRMYDTFRGSMIRPMGVFMIIAAIIWLMITWNSEQAWMFMLFLAMIAVGVLLIATKTESAELGGGAGDRLVEAVKKANWEGDAVNGRMALLGGSFDPIHTGHLDLARAVARRLDLDRVVLMPTAIPPHKLRSRMATGTDRLTMCRIATVGDPLFEVSDYEITHGGASFTVNTLEYLTALHPQTKWYLVVGADMFMTLSTWKRFEDIARMAVLCTAPRDDVTMAQLQEQADKLTAMGAKCELLDLPLMPVSSTDLRKAIQDGEPTGDWLPSTVAEYIREKNLYTESTENDQMTDEQFIEIIRGRLTEKRFHHSLEVAKEARRLAEKYGADPAKAYTAGLLHDIMKDTDGKVQLQILNDFGILQDDVEKQAPKLWHAHCGAVFLQYVLGIEDEEIITAVRYHTTARAGMTLFEKILYLADFTSADRDYPDVDEMRRLVEIGIGPAMEYALQYSIDDLKVNGREIHPDTLAAYNEVVAQR